MKTALFVAAVGAVTPVGLTAAQTAACVRARVSLFTERQLLPPPAEGVVSAVVPARTTVKRTPHRWLAQLAARAIGEALAGITVDPSRTALILCVPEAFRHHPALLSDASNLFSTIVRILGRGPFSRTSASLDCGHAAVFQGLQLAQGLLTDGEVDACVVGGVDSLVHSNDVDRLAANGWLHGPANPQGTIPGEGAAFLLVSTDANLGGGQPLARITGVGTAVESDHALTERLATGQGLRQAIEKALVAAQIAEPDVGLRVSDMNGERSRAWDTMIGSMRAYRSRRERFPVWYPAAATGDLGAAAGGLGLLVATLGIARGYAPASCAVCEGSSDEGLRGAAVVTAHSSAPPFRSKLRTNTSGRRAHPAVIAGLADSLAEDLAFVVCQRRHLSLRPDVDLQFLAEHDQRIDAMIDAVRVLGDTGVRACDEACAMGMGGEEFAPTLLAIERRDQARLEEIIAVTEADPARTIDLCAAFAWADSDELRGIVAPMLNHPVSVARYVAIDCCVQHGVSPGDALERLIRDESEVVRARGYRAIGELRLHEYLTDCRAGCADSVADVRIEAAISSAHLGDIGSARAVLEPVCLQAQDCSPEALQVLLTRLAPHDAHGVLMAMRQHRAPESRLVIGAGINGDPAYIPWMIDKMNEPALAPLAGQAFMRITGVDLGDPTKRLTRPPAARASSAEAPGSESLEGADELPWPDGQAIRAWWSGHSLPAGVRCFLGDTDVVRSSLAALRSAAQPERHIAALYLAHSRPEALLFNTTGPSWRQRKRLAELG